MEGGGELLDLEVAQGDDDLAGAVVAAEDLHVPGPAGVVGRGAVLVGVQPVGAHHPLEIQDAGLAALGQLDQGLVHSGVGAVQPGHGPHRRVRQPALAERLGHDGPALQLVGDPQFLERGGAGHVGPPHQPARARQLAIEGPQPVAVELGQPLQPPRLGPIHIGALLDQPFTDIHHATSSSLARSLTRRSSGPTPRHRTTLPEHTFVGHHFFRGPSRLLACSTTPATLPADRWLGSFPQLVGDWMRLLKRTVPLLVSRIRKRKG